MAKVSKRGGFSDRNAIKPENTEIQLKDFDKHTRIQLQNMISELFSKVYDGEYYKDKRIQEYLIFVLGTVYSEPIKAGYYYDKYKVMDLIENTICNDEYDDVLTLIEAIVQYWDDYLKERDGGRYFSEFDETYINGSIFDIANIYFEREYVGYRFVDGEIVPISDKYELAAIEEALSNKYKSVQGHIAKANHLLADRTNPDYENSIKESISAVEAICKIFTGAKGKEATLGNMLKKLEEKGVKIHGGLKSAFNILYGYASDANGIRNAGDIGGPSSTFEEAKFMLVSCSAFINYLIVVSAD